MNSIGNCIVVLLLLVFAPQASSMMDVTFEVKPLSLPINWEPKGNIVLCLTEDSSTCIIYAMWMFSPSSLTENGKRFTKRVWMPWSGKTMEVKTREMSTNETVLLDVTHLDPRGATSASFDIFDVVQLTVSVKCSEYFWGEFCDYGCKPREDVYICDEEGGKICINGRIGDLCDQEVPGRNFGPSAAALVDVKTSARVTPDEAVVEDKQRKMTVAVGALAVMAVGGVLVALTISRNRRRSSGLIRGQLDALVEA